MSRRNRVTAVRAVVIASILVALMVFPVTRPATPAAAHEDDGEGGPPVFLVHGMPDTVFEVQVGPDRRLKGLRFGQFYNLRAFAGSTLAFAFTVSDTGEPVVATDGFPVPADRSRSLVVHHAMDGSGALTAFENALDPLEPATSRLIVRHLAVAGPVDVLVDGERVLTGIQHGWEESIELPTGDVSVTLVVAGSRTPAVEPVDVSLTPGDRIVVYGFGSEVDGTVTAVVDVVHGGQEGSGDGLPLRAMVASTALAGVIGAVGLNRIRRRRESHADMRRTSERPASTR